MLEDLIFSHVLEFANGAVYDNDEFFLRVAVGCHDLAMRVVLAHHPLNEEPKSLLLEIFEETNSKSEVHYKELPLGVRPVCRRAHDNVVYIDDSFCFVFQEFCHLGVQLGLLACLVVFILNVPVDFID